MQLLGAREFIKMSPGTFYVQYWVNTEEQCLEIIDKFKNNQKSFSDIDGDDLHIFGDNWGSMSFSGAKEDDYIFYWDANVVGDAGPSTTLYLVIEENELPKKLTICDEDDNTVEVSKKEIINIKNIFVNDVYEKNDDEWPFKELNKLSVEGNKIVDIKIVG
jgi:hypothetical protein